MAFFIGSLAGIGLGWLASLLTGYSLILTIPILWAVNVFGFSYFAISMAEKKLRKQVSNLPSVTSMFDEVKSRLADLSDWERDFISDIDKKATGKKDFFGSKASIKQLNIIAQIYVERIRGAKLKGREYTLEAVDSETGEVRTLTIGSSK
jgi:hypothetical protein